MNTGQRVSDVVKMGRKHVKDGAITITQKKSGETVEVTIPILPALNVVLDEVQARRISDLPNQSIRAARTEGGLSTMFAEWRKQAGLPDDLHAHGLRKAFCRVAAEAGMTVTRRWARSCATPPRWTARTGRQMAKIKP